MSFYFVFWGLLVFVFLFVSSSLLFSLLVLELLCFVSLFFMASSLSVSFASDCLLIFFFSFFVMEGVVGLTGFVVLVFFTGADYVGSLSLVNL